MNLITNHQTTNYFKDRVNKCTYIMLHHTGGAGDEQQAKYLATGTKKVSCHYVVGQEGGIYQLATDDKCTRHAGKGSYKGIIGNMNDYAIGVEIVSKTGEDYTDIQRSAVRKLMEYLLKKHNLGVESIIRHKDYTSRKWDVGDKFRDPYFKSWEDYKNSYNKTKSTLLLEEQDHLDQMMENNGKMRGKTKNQSLKDFMHTVNNQIKDFIKKSKV